jgi:hypothetical protein
MRDIRKECLENHGETKTFTYDGLCVMCFIEKYIQECEYEVPELRLSDIKCEKVRCKVYN